MARGGIIDEDALRGGAARAEDRRRGGWTSSRASRWPPTTRSAPLPNVLLTPHLGASTAEAQRSVALEACAAVRDALLTGDLSAALNAAGVGGAGWGELRPLLDLAERLGRLGRALLPGGAQRDGAALLRAPRGGARARSCSPPCRARCATWWTSAPSTW